MDLWIRSQDKETLTKVKSVFYRTNEENEHLIGTIVIDNVHNGIIKIGQYKTKERALEVLDEIHNILKPKGIIKFDGMLSKEATEKAKEYFSNQYMIFNKNMELLQQVETYVYEMPIE